MLRDVRLAVLSDIHGNPVALDAVLADVDRRGGAQNYLVLGDLVSHGYDPAGVLNRLAQLPHLRALRGNADRWTVTLEWEGPTPTAAEAAANPQHVPTVVGVARAFGWTNGYLAAGWLDWLGALPIEQRFDLPDGTRVLGVHAAPGRDHGVDVTPEMSDEELASHLVGCGADLVFVGNSHTVVDRRVNGIHVVNPGSISNPLPWIPDKRASYALVEASADTYDVRVHRVAYDREAWVRAIERSHVPNAEWLLGLWPDPASPETAQPGRPGSA